MLNQMCGRFTLKSPGRTRFDRVDRSDLPVLVPRYNIAPTQPIVAIIKKEAVVTAAMLQWGLIPSWSHEAKGFINARSETLCDKRSFRESFQRRRCLIPADGFYEWKRIGRSKQPHYFQMTDESPFMFAGIWDEWRRGRVGITSCAIITTTANELLAPVHDRMPVILNAEFHDAWLDPDSRTDDLKNLLAPFPASGMKSHQVSGAVNHAKNDGEDLLNPPETESGVNLSLF